MSEAASDTLPFEQALARLEEIVRLLERGEAPLEESLRLFQEGSALRGQCQARLDAARERIERITLDAEGRPTGARPFDEA